MGTPARPTSAPPPLTVRECLGLCRWLPSRARTADGGQLFACRGCGSQWRAGEAWTPVDQDGSVPPAVQAAVAARAPATSDRCAGGAGSGGT